MRAIILVPLIALFACADPPPDAQVPGAQLPETGPPAPGADPPAAESAEFALVRGADTLLTESYSRRGNTLQGELRSPNGERLSWQARVASNATIDSMHVAWFPEGEPNAAEQGTVVIRGDSLIARTVRGDAPPDTERLQVPPGTLLQLANSAALSEQLLRRFRLMGQDSAFVPVLLIGRDEAEHDVIENVSISQLSGDSVALELGSGNVMRVAVAPDGRILGATTANGEIRLVRVR